MSGKKLVIKKMAGGYGQYSDWVPLEPTDYIFFDALSCISGGIGGFLLSKGTIPGLMGGCFAGLVLFNGAAVLAADASGFNSSGPIHDPIFDGEKPTGGSKLPTDSYFKGGSLRYYWDGDGTDLVVKDGEDELIIEGFTNGDLGINLKMEEPPLPETFTTDQLNSRWHDHIHYSFWAPLNDEFNSAEWVHFMTGYFEHGADYVYMNVQPDLMGKGEWVAWEEGALGYDHGCPDATFGEMSGFNLNRNPVNRNLHNISYKFRNNLQDVA